MQKEVLHADTDSILSSLRLYNSSSLKIMLSLGTLQVHNTFNESTGLHFLSRASKLRNPLLFSGKSSQLQTRLL